MGRPINKRYFGDPVGGTQIRVECNTGNGAVDTGYIVAQKGTNKFKVTDGTTTLDCRLVNKATGSLASGEMVAFGFKTDGANVRLKKLFNRTAIDFSGNRYTWAIEDDSTETVMRLTDI